MTDDGTLSDRLRRKRRDIMRTSGPECVQHPKFSGALLVTCPGHGTGMLPARSRVAVGGKTTTKHAYSRM